MATVCLSWRDMIRPVEYIASFAVVSAPGSGCHSSLFVLQSVAPPPLIPNNAARYPTSAIHNRCVRTPQIGSLPLVLLILQRGFALLTLGTFKIRGCLDPIFISAWFRGERCSPAIGVHAPLRESRDEVKVEKWGKWGVMGWEQIGWGDTHT